MEQLGIEPMQLLTQTINFVIVAFLLTKFLYKPILKMLEERKKKIQEGLAYTESMKKEMEKTQTKREALITKAKEEANDIIEEARKSAKQVEADIVADGHKEVEALRKREKNEIALEREEMKRHIQTSSVDVAIAIVEKLLRETLSDASQKRIIDKKIASLRHSLPKS